MKKIIVILLSLLPLLGYSQFPVSDSKMKVLDPTKWKVSFSKSEVKVNGTVDIVFSVSIDEGWQLYSAGEDPPHALFSFEENPAYTLVGKLKEGPGVKEKFDENLELNVKYFNKTAEFRQTIKILKTNPVINIEVEGQSCPNGPGQCVRVNKSFILKDIKVIASATEPANPKGKTETAVVKTPDSKNPDPALTSGKAKGNSAKGSSERVKELEKEKEKLVTKDSQGKDESVEILRSFADKYRAKK